MAKECGLQTVVYQMKNGRWRYRFEAVGLGLGKLKPWKPLNHSFRAREGAAIEAVLFLKILG